MGGRAVAMFAGINKNHETSEQKEKYLNSEINASYGFTYKKESEDKNSGKVSGDLNLGRSNSSATSVTNQFESVMMTIKTIGGNSSFSSFSVPKEVNNTNVDLSNWINSVNDRDTHSIVEFGAGGLVPITEFIIERNLREQLESYYATGIDSYEQLVEPCVYIQISNSMGRFIVVETLLRTRFGNCISLRRKFMVCPTKEAFDSYVNSEAERVSKMFKVKISSTNKKKTIRRQMGSQPLNNFEFDGFEEEDLVKVTHNGTIYIVSNYVITNTSHPLCGKKFALSIHDDNIIDEYAMKDFINRLPTIDMDYEDLINSYIIDAL